ncbi:MAG: hypothetical protein K8S25_11230 [Alphaproteobacteria bacterium]|nr:hypothetical protein [Alphaproteobacteria bacterium]
MYRAVALAGAFFFANVAPAAVAAEAPTARPSPQATVPCEMFTQALAMARAGREGQALPAFTNDIAQTTKAYLGAPRCSSFLSRGGATVNCPVSGNDAAWALRFWRERIAAVAACVPGWRRQDLSARYTQFTSLEGSDSIAISMPDPAYGPMVETSTTYGACEPLDEMMGRARIGRLHNKEPVPTTQPARLEMRYLGAEACTVRAVEASGGYAVACVFPQADNATSKGAAGNVIKTAAACYPKWTQTTLSDGMSFEKGDGISFMVEARDERPAGFMMTFDPKAAALPAR